MTESHLTGRGSCNTLLLTDIGVSERWQLGLDHSFTRAMNGQGSVVKIMRNRLSCCVSHQSVNLTLVNFFLVNLQSKCFLFGPVTSSVVALHTLLARPCPDILCLAAFSLSTTLWPDIPKFFGDPSAKKIVRFSFQIQETNYYHIRILLTTLRT